MSTKQNKFSKDSFCPEVYNQIQIDMQGYLRACCLFNDDNSGSAKDSNGTPMKVQTHSILDAMNSDTHKLVRLEYSKGVQPETCKNCYSWEKYHGGSRRTKFNDFAESVLPDYVKVSDAYDVTGEDGSIDTAKVKLVNLDIRFGNLCNLKCIMCDPANSSLWYEDWDALSRKFTDYSATGRSHSFRQGGLDPVTGDAQYWKGKNIKILLKKDEHDKIKLEGMEPWWETENWKKQFESLKPQIRFIYFTGGEPMVVPGMSDMLDELIADGHANMINLSYDTNLTVINQNLIDKWKKFKSVSIRVSVDETDARFNIIRNPGNFEKVKANIIRIQSSGIKIKQLSLVCGIANVYGVVRVAKFAHAHGIGFGLRFINTPQWLNIKYLALSAREEICEELQKIYDSLDPSEIDGVGKYLLMEINHIKGLAEEESGAHMMIRTFVKTMNLLDELRGTDWKTTLADVANLITKHHPNVELNLT